MENTRAQLLQSLHNNPQIVPVKPRDLKAGDIVEKHIGMSNNIEAIVYWEIKSIQLYHRKYYIHLAGIAGEGAPVRKGFYVTFTNPEKHFSIVDGDAVYQKVII